MYLFWFIPILLAVVIGFWAVGGMVFRRSGVGIKTSGKVLTDKSPHDEDDDRYAD